MIYLSWENSVNLDATSEGIITVTTPVSLGGMRFSKSPRLVYCAAVCYYHDAGNWELSYGYVFLDGSLEAIVPNLGTVTEDKAATTTTTETPNRILLKSLAMQAPVSMYYKPGILLPVDFDIVTVQVNQVNPAINDDYVQSITLGIEEGE